MRVNFRRYRYPTHRFIASERKITCIRAVVRISYIWPAYTESEWENSIKFMIVYPHFYSSYIEELNDFLHVNFKVVCISGNQIEESSYMVDFCV